MGGAGGLLGETIPLKTDIAFSVFYLVFVIFLFIYLFTFEIIKKFNLHILRIFILVGGY